MDNVVTIEDLSTNKHILRYASLLSTTQSFVWKNKHRSFLFFHTIVKDILPLFQGETFDGYAFILRWDKLFIRLSIEDRTLHLHPGDILWFHEMILQHDSKYAQMVISTILGIASTKKTYHSLKQVAQMSGIPESVLRQRAVSGDIPGAGVMGKVIVVSGLSLLCAGINIGTSSGLFDWLNGSFCA